MQPDQHAPRPPKSSPGRPGTAPPRPPMPCRRTPAVRTRGGGGQQGLGSATRMCRGTMHQVARTAPLLTLPNHQQFEQAEPHLRPSAPRRACRRTRSGTSPCRRRTGTAGGRGRGTCTPGRTRAPAPRMRLAAAEATGRGGQGRVGRGRVGEMLTNWCCRDQASCKLWLLLPGAHMQHAASTRPPMATATGQLTPSRRLRMRSSRSRCRRSSCGSTGAGQGRGSGGQFQRPRTPFSVCCLHKSSSSHNNLMLPCPGS